MRSRTLIMMLAGLAVAVAVVVIALWPTRPNRVTRENYDRIQIGMTQAEVEAILGPLGDYATVPFDNGRSEVDPSDLYSQVVRSFSSIDDASNRVRACWSGNDYLIVITFDPKSEVISKGCTEQLRIEQGPLRNAVWRLKRQWHRWFP
jgi:hypothetical protein